MSFSSEAQGQCFPLDLLCPLGVRQTNIQWNYNDTQMIVANNNVFKKKKRHLILLVTIRVSFTLKTFKLNVNPAQCEPS